MPSWWICSVCRAELAAMPKSSPFPMEDAPNYNPDDPYADKVALTDHRHYLLGQHFIKEGRVRVRTVGCYCECSHPVQHSLRSQMDDSKT